jgi:hypothetical protein
MSDPKDDQPNWSEVVRLMRKARAKSRGYATYWEWSPDRRLEELGVAGALCEFLEHSEGAFWKSREPIANDPPDVLLVSTGGLRIGLEMTELVDGCTVERHRYRKKNGIAQPYDWADWTVDQLDSAILKVTESKDQKLASRSADYDEVWVAIYTDEPMITLDLASRALLTCAPHVRTLNRAFFLLSYDPAADKTVYPQGVRVLPIALASI